MPFTSDLSEWPILMCKAVGDSSDQDIKDYIALLSRKLALKQPHVVIVDATAGKAMKGTHRKMLGEWNTANADELSKYRAGLLLVSGSATVRGVLTAIYWLSKPPFPYQAVATVADARRLAKEMLEKHW